MEVESTFGKTVGNTMVSGLIMICLALVSTYGAMAGDTKVSTMKIRNRDTVCIIGLMEGDTKVGGTKANNTVWANILILPKVRLSSVYGKVERE